MGRIAHMGQMSNVFILWTGRFSMEECLGVISLEWICKKEGVLVWAGFRCLGIGYFCEQVLNFKVSREFLTSRINISCYMKILHLKLVLYLLCLVSKSMTYVVKCLCARFKIKRTCKSRVSCLIR